MNQYLSDGRWGKTDRQSGRLLLIPWLKKKGRGYSEARVAWTDECKLASTPPVEQVTPHGPAYTANVS